MVDICKGFTPANTDKCTKWAVGVFSSWVEERNKRCVDDQCPIDLLEKPNGEGLNHWLSRARFPNKKSLAQHVRNQHAAAASEQRAAQTANSVQRTLWTDGEHRLFLEALARLGPSSNIKLAELVGSKTTTTKQVVNHKFF